jgi:hypothetical protein
VKDLARDLELTSVTNVGENTNSTDATQALLAISVQGPIIPMLSPNSKVVQNQKKN